MAEEPNREEEEGDEKTGLSVNRRDLLKITGAGAAAAVGPEIGYKAWWKLWDTSDGTEKGDWQPVPRGDEKYAPTVCQACQGSCGIHVRTVNTPEVVPDEAKDVDWADTRMVKLDGNPANPVSEGTMCPKGQKSLQAHYHPARVTQPLKNVGEKGNPEWQEISWSEALSTVATKLSEVRTGGNPERVAFLDGEDAETSMQRLVRRFMDAYGSPNYIQKPPATSDERLMPSPRPDGGEGFYDIEKADHLLSLGLNFTEAFYSPVEGMRAYSTLKENRAKLTYVGSRKSMTGVKSHEWVHVEPGTEALLALGMAKVIVGEGLHDEAFVQENTSNFSALEEELQSHSLETIAGEAGLEPDEIRSAAREFAAYGSGAVAVSTSSRPAEAGAHTLNLLTGSAGEHWHEHDYEAAFPYADLGAVETDSVAEEGLASDKVTAVGTEHPMADEAFSTFADSVIDEDPYPLEALFVYYANPLTSAPNRGKTKKALENVPLVVNFSPFLDETAEHSDIVLPDHSPFERVGDAPHFLLDGTPTLSLRQPVVEPRGNSRPTGDVMLELASRVGPPVSSSLPWESYEAYLDESLKGIYESGEGRCVQPTITDEEKLFWHRVRGKEDQGIEYLPNDHDQHPPTSIGFEPWKTTLAHGAWKSPGLQKGLEGEGEFRPDALAAAGDVAAPEEGGDYPFRLNTYKLMSVTKPRNTAEPSMFDLSAPHTTKAWWAWVEMHPRTAEELGIKDDQWVWLESPQGQEKFEVQLYKGTPPGVVNVPLNIGSQGYPGGKIGQKNYNTWAKEEAQNPMDLLEDERDPLDGRFLQRTKVKISASKSHPENKPWGGLL